MIYHSSGLRFIIFIIGFVIITFKRFCDSSLKRFCDLSLSRSFVIYHSGGFVIYHYQEILWFITQEVLWFFNIKRLCDSILVLIFEYITILKQLPNYSSCRVLGTYPGFETITRIHINVKFQAFAHLRINTRFFDKVKYKNRKQKYCSFMI